MNKIIAERYEIIDLIGQGGMADVYLAKDTILNRTIAIKILRTSLAKDPLYITRFQREASAAAALSHKNIVEIYDVGEDEDQYYIVMEYVPGTTLKELILKRGAVHVVEAIDIMKQVVSGVAKAHQLKIVHRDLKPQNILVTDSGTAKIADFGIASMQSLAQVTQTDVIMGSLHYLAPELARGEKATIQSDIYALGIVLYELLRGEVPFNGESPVNIALKHLNEELPSLLDFNPTIPQSVENVIIKATAKNLHDRYHNAKEMLQDLETCLDRLNEEKLVFDHSIDNDPTIVLDPKTSFFNNNEEHTPVKEVVKENSHPDGLWDKIKKLPTKIKVAIGVGAVAVIGLIVALIMIFGGGAQESSLMPNLTGMTREKAVQALEEYKIVVNDKDIEELSDDYEEGQIIDTDPKSGASIKEGDTVTFTVSLGKYIIIADYSDREFDDVEKELIELGFNVEREDVVSNKDVGVVVGQSLDKGYKQDPTINDRTITLQVSKGDYVVIDDYVGKKYSEAEAALKKLGFNVTKRTEVSDEDEGTVIAQNLAKGYKVDPSDTDRNITLTVAAGYSANVPNVVGYTVSTATTRLENAGFVVKTQVLDPSAIQDDPESVVPFQVVEQSLEAGTQVNKKGTVVTISYYETKPDVPDDNDSEGTTEN